MILDVMDQIAVFARVDNTDIAPFELVDDGGEDVLDEQWFLVCHWIVRLVHIKMVRQLQCESIIIGANHFENLLFGQDYCLIWMWKGFNLHVEMSNYSLDVDQRILQFVRGIPRSGILFGNVTQCCGEIDWF